MHSMSFFHQLLYCRNLIENRKKNKKRHFQLRHTAVNIFFAPNKKELALKWHIFINFSTLVLYYKKKFSTSVLLSLMTVSLRILDIDDILNFSQSIQLQDRLVASERESAITRIS